MSRNIRAVVLFGTLLIIFLISGCGSSLDKYKFTPTNNWIEYSNGSIQTWDAQRLQKIVPFKIVFPKYLPEELKDLPPLLHKHTEDESNTFVRILYEPIQGPEEIDIEEVNTIYERQTSPDIEHTYFDIEGIRVLEEKIWDYVYRSGQEILEPKLYYMWNQDNLSFHVVVTAYEQTIARKIVESMIIQ